MTTRKLEQSIDSLEREMRRIFDVTELIKYSLTDMKNEAGNLIAMMNHLSLINDLHMIFDAKKLELCK